MKLSKYNLFINCNNTWLIFNSFTCALAEISYDTKQLLEGSISSIKNCELLKNLKNGGYIVEDYIDETQVLKFLRLYNKFNNNEASITIAITLACNFSCIYCFEQHSPIFISDDVKFAIYNRVEHMAKSGININITWYGGEPLLYKSIIWEMSEKLISICKQYNVNYNAIIVTNAYLLDEQTISNIKKYKINQIQTTLDGPEDIHNSMRKLLGDNNNGTFQKIVNNLELAVKNNLKIHIRLHINKVNEYKLNDLLSVLETKGLNACSIDLGQIKPYTKNCESVIGTCLNTKKFAERSLHYQPLFEKHGFDTFYFDYPSPILSYCRKFYSINDLIIGPTGELYSCWVEIGDKNSVVGSIFDQKYKTEIDFRILPNFMWSPFDYKTCTDCNILPICMGGCTHCFKQNGTLDCQIWKYSLQDVLKHKYDKYKNNAIQKNKAINYIVYPK